MIITSSCPVCTLKEHMEKKFDTTLLLLFFATLMAPLSTEVVGEAKIYLFDFPLAAMYVTFFTRVCMRRMRVRFEFFDLLFLLFFIWISICAFHGKNFAASLEWLLYWVRAYLIIFYMRHHVGVWISERLFFTAIGFCLVLEPVLAVIQTITQSSVGVVQQYFGVLKTHQSNWNFEGEVVTRAQGTFVHTNFLANWLIMLMPFVQANWTNHRQKLRNSYALWWLFCLLALILTLSRASWMAFAIGFVTLLFAESRYRTTSMRKRKWAAYLLAPVVLVALAFTFFEERSELIGRAAWARTIRIFDDHSSNLRSDLTDAAFVVLQKHPYLGVGMGNSNEIIHASNTFIPDRFQATVHNIYLIVATENGLFGAFLFVLLLWWPLRQIVRVLRAGGAEKFRVSGNFAIAFLACFTSLYFAMFWYVGMFHESEFPLIMTLIGAALGLSRTMMRRLQPAKATAPARDEISPLAAPLRSGQRPDLVPVRYSQTASSTRE